MKIAFVVQRYGLEINGGAELHCRWIAEHMSKFWEIDVLTTRALDYISWENYYTASMEKINGITVRRFPVVKPRDPEKFGRTQNYILNNEHAAKDELRWLEEEGPNSPALIAYIREHEAEYAYFIFFSYRYYHSYFGLETVAHKGVLVPTAERDDIIHLPIFKELFRKPRAFIYNSVEEKLMINTLSRNDKIPGDIIGVGAEVPDKFSVSDFREKYSLSGDYIIYIGRIDENKGCAQLFDYFIRFKEETGSTVKLVLVGSTILKIPPHPDIHYLGFLPEKDKFSALAGGQLLLMPSFYESLSMVTNEAWAMGKPVLANAFCDVLKGQCRRSNAGLYYADYCEFKATLALLLGSKRLRSQMGNNGRAYFTANYTWDKIEQKYLSLFACLNKEN